MSAIHASGKRKRAIARATLKPGKGLIYVNNRRLDFFENRVTQLRINEPLILIGDKAKQVDIHVRTSGGGSNGQAEAARLAIARALVDYDGKLRKIFEEYDRLLLVADVRRKEPRKPGRHSKARAKTQKSYR
ncbi:30S ribosomal protein S9 [Candidatus Woesearchaeota archaeon]|nr:30S ribosomal protein S9 [Candidatus Woesearchaeota archaeon]